MPEHLPEWITAGVVIAGVIYNSGILAGAVKNHTDRLDKQEEKSERHGERITLLEAWHEAHR